MKKGLITTLIDKFYLERERQKKERDRIKFFISEIGRCERAIFFRFKKAPALEIEPERLRIFEEGEIIQQRILRHLFSLGIVRATEIPIPPQEMISGRADAIITFTQSVVSELGLENLEEIEFGEPYILEIKSISGKLGGLDKLQTPKENHLFQLQLYLHYFKIKKGILLYLDKDTQEMKEFWVKYEPEKVEKLLAWFEKLKEKIKKNVVPVRHPEWPKYWECRSCEFSEICEIGGEKEIIWEELKKKIEKASEEISKNSI